MSYHLTDSHGTITLQHYRPSTEIGHRGPIGPLPPDMAAGVRSWRTQMDEQRGPDWTEQVRVGFKARNHEPVLAIRAEGDETFAFIYRSGTVAYRRSSEALDTHTDQVEWSRLVIGLDNLAEGWLRTWAECDPREHHDFAQRLAVIA